MAKCKKIYRQKKRVCTGSLNKPIIIYDKKLNPTAEYGGKIDLINPIIAWSMVETIDGIPVVDGSNITFLGTHNFYIRYLAGYTDTIDKEFLVRYNGTDYKILKIENLNEENSFLKISCNERGLDKQRNRP